MTPPPAVAATAPAVAPRRAPNRGRPTPPQRLRPPRRVSGPARPARRPAGAARTTSRVRTGLVGVHLPDRLLDRLIGGRAWIAVVALALIGIVAMQLWVVKLGVGIGRAFEHESLLQRENSVLAVENSSLASGERIERLALAQGMTIAPPGALHFDTLRGSLDVHLAAAALARPAQTSPASAVGTSTAATSVEASSAAVGVAASTAATAAEASTAATGAEASTAAAGVEASAGAPTGSETAPGEASSQSAPVASTTPASTPEASTPTPSATGGASEAASVATSGGGTQAAPGG